MPGMSGIEREKILTKGAGDLKYLEGTVGVGSWGLPPEVGEVIKRGGTVWVVPVECADSPDEIAYAIATTGDSGVSSEEERAPKIQTFATIARGAEAVSELDLSNGNGLILFLVPDFSSGVVSERLVENLRQTVGSGVKMALALRPAVEWNEAVGGKAKGIEQLAGDLFPEGAIIGMGADLKGNCCPWLVGDLTPPAS